MTSPKIGSRGKLVWSGRPSVSVFSFLYGLVSIIIIAALLILELLMTANFSAGAILFPSTISINGFVVPYPIEIITTIVVLIAYVGEVIQLALLRARHKYELYEDGLYVDSGIVNLQNTFISPMAFSDARLYRNWAMRLVHRGLIIVDANDDRHFKLMLLENPTIVQDLIRRTLGHPVVRIESETELLTKE